MADAWFMNVWIWFGCAILFFLMFTACVIFLIMLAKWTHAMVEFKAKLKGKPICLFFQENRYVEWRPEIVEAGIIIDKDFGAFIVNERATYIDRKTKNIMIPFDAQFGASVNIHAAKLADDLQFVMKDDEAMKTLRNAISNNELDDDVSLQVLKTSIHLGAIKSMMTALIPHNINAKIEKVIASRMKGLSTINTGQVILTFVAIFGAILLGYLIIRLATNK